MSGILGIWNLDGPPVEQELLGRLAALLAHRGPDGLGGWIRGPVGLACQLLRVTPESLHETQPFADPTGIVIVFDGRLDDREDVLAHLPGLDKDCSDAALAAAAYRAFGDGFAQKLNGDFA